MQSCHWLIMWSVEEFLIILCGELNVTSHFWLMLWKVTSRLILELCPVLSVHKADENAGTSCFFSSDSASY